jgi:hypothetical protein
MVTTDPRAVDDRRKFKEALIRVVDMLAYLAVFLGGIGALFSTPQTVKAALYGFPWLIVIWGILLLVGGVLGFVGRLSRIWVIEIPGASAGFFGAAMYFVILGMAAVALPTALVAVALVACMMFLLGRRYLELQILTSEPGHVKFRDKVRAVMRRRTTNTVSKHH